MSMNKLFISTGLALIMMIFFQNCQRAKMAAKGDSDLGSLQVVNGDDFQPPPTDPPPTDPPPTDPPPTDPPVACPTDDGDQDSDDHSHDKYSKAGYNYDDHSSDDNSGDDCKDHHGKEKGNREYICGISGPGKSDRIGIDENEQLASQHDSHKGKKLVCMSEHACEVIVRKAFPESHTIRYGWCKDDSNKNVQHLGDEKMKLLVDKYIQDNGPYVPKN